jgi:hypothetical protein
MVINRLAVRVREKRKRKKKEKKDMMNTPLYWVSV